MMGVSLVWIVESTGKRHYLVSARCGDALLGQKLKEFMANVRVEKAVNDWVGDSR